MVSFFLVGQEILVVMINVVHLVSIVMKLMMKMGLLSIHVSGILLLDWR